MDVVAQARAMAPDIAARSGEIEAARRLPADIARRFAAAGFFRMAVPAAVGGLEVEPATLFRTIEAVGQADASAGWCVTIGATTGVTAAYLAPDEARGLYGDPLAITGGVFAPMGRATVEPDGYRVSGRWQWASGSANCHWLMGGSILLDDGKPRLLPNGMPDARMMIFPAGEATLIDSWHVSGLCGTGSGEMEVQGILVPRARSVSLMTDRPTASGALYAFPVFGLLALGIAAVMLGNARGAIDDLVELAGGKKPQGSPKTLAERPTALVTLAVAEPALRGARAFFYEAVAEAWEKARGDGEIGVAERAALRLAATHAARTAARVTRDMYDLGGGSSVFLASSLQRRFRDGHVGTQHLMVSPPTLELAGRVLMGLPTDATQL
ncbi:MAG: acyl-CoA dehydrogenase family protein [Ferrovibrionaceae bacterium]